MVWIVAFMVFALVISCTILRSPPLSDQTPSPT